VFSRWTSTSRTLAVAAALAAALGAGWATAATPADQGRTVAERNVLRSLARNWNPIRISAFVDPRTRLARDNVQAACRHPRSSSSRTRYVCVVRPGRRDDRTRLYLTYRQLGQHRFVVHWLDLRR